MITLIEALNFRCFKYMRQPIGKFHVLVGPNASGKSSFLDVLGFLSTLIADGLEAAIAERTNSFQDLVWRKAGQVFELAVEAQMPREVAAAFPEDEVQVIRYEVAIALNESSGEASIKNQRILFLPQQKPHTDHVVQERKPPKSLFQEKGLPLVSWGKPRLVTSDMFGGDPGKALPARVSETENAATWWFGQFLSHDVCKVNLVQEKLRQPSPPGKGKLPKGDGSNLPWVLAWLRGSESDAFEEWLHHIRSAIPNIADVKIIEREEDKYKYLMLVYSDGLTIPSWMVSDGTLRLLYLSSLAYLPNTRRVYLIEEPENSLHPLNIESVMQPLQSIYYGQVLIATHSPIVLSTVALDDILVFWQEENSGTHLATGSQHPGLKQWRGEVSLGTLFAGGVFG